MKKRLIVSQLFLRTYQSFLKSNDAGKFNKSLQSLKKIKKNKSIERSFFLCSI